MATSEYCSCPARLPTPTASHVAIASGVNHRVTSPRWTSARSYAGQFPTRYFVLHLGCTLDFTSRSCPFGRHDGQGRDEHLLPRTNATIRQVQQAGRRQWKKDSGYHQQARVENAFFRYKLIIGESLRARSRAGQETEAILACNILNQMTQLGRPASYAIGR